MTGQTVKRVLIVEDDVLLALDLADMLHILGYEIAGQASRIDLAMTLAREGVIDFAVLDVNLAGTRSFPVADILRQRDIPFAFATGYGAEGLSADYRDVPRLEKPYAQDDLEQAIAEVFRGRPR